jgi:DNA modification methylase
MHKPIDRSLTAESHPAHYLMHKYWARKPFNIVRSYIEHFTGPGDIVLDPFAGSGVTLIESLIIGRKAIAIDINPAASLITEATVIPFDAIKFLEVFAQIERTVKPEIDKLFITICPKCSNSASVTHVVWENIASCPNCNKELHLGEVEKIRGRYRCPHCTALVFIPSKLVQEERMMELWYVCPLCRNHETKRKEPDSWDQKLVRKYSKQSCHSAIKNGRMFLSNRTLIYEGMSVESFFTSRNLYALSLLINEIHKVKDQTVRRLFEFVFTASVAQASRLIAYRNGLTTGGPAWTVSGFWVPNIHLELNAWNCFANRFKKVLRGKKHLLRELPENYYRPAKSINELYDDKNAWILTRTSTDLTDILPDESVDYIFTDPPYGDSVPFLEYSILWFSWLGLTADYENEIIISDSVERSKDIHAYATLLKKVFIECYRILKPGHWLSLTFNNRRLDVWNAIISSIAVAKFEFVNCLYQVPAVIPAKAQLSKAGSVTGDIILNYRKPQRGKIHQVRRSNRSVTDIILSEAEQIIAERGGSSTTDQITRGVIMALLKEGQTQISEHDIVETLKLRFLDKGNSHWEFRGEEHNLIHHYEQLTDVIRKIIKQCFIDGTYEPKSVISEVLSHLRNGRTPDLKCILAIYEEVKTEDKSKGRTSPQLKLPFISEE